LPVTISLGKLGEASGPPLADVITLAKLRQAFLSGEPLPETLATSALAAPSNERPRITITSGRPASHEPPPAPPPAEYAGPSEIDDDIPF
jgi:hypothetical protein